MGRRSVTPAAIWWLLQSIAGCGLIVIGFIIGGNEGRNGTLLGAVWLLTGVGLFRRALRSDGS